MNYILNNLIQLTIDEIFRSGDAASIDRLVDGKAIFIRYMIFPDPVLHIMPYKLSPTPGRVEGISGSILDGFNVGIINHIDEKKKKKAIEAFIYMTSEAVQKKFLMRRETLPGIKKLYYDEEVCAEADCELFTSLQPIGKPNDHIEKYDDYIKEYREYVYEFLYGNKSAKEVLRNVDYMSRVYYISLDTKETSLGLCSTIFAISVSALMILSLVFIFKINFAPFFAFLSIDLWILTVLGSVMTLSITYTYIGEMTTKKCHLEFLLLSLGFTFSYGPILYKLIVNFPEKNSFSSWVKKNKYIFIFSLILIDLILNGVIALNGSITETLYINKGQNFKVCINYNMASDIMICLILGIKILIVFIILALMFIEWNIQVTLYDIRFIISSIYINLLLMMLYVIFKYLRIKNFISYFIIQESIIVVIAISNYVFIYGYRLVLALFRKQDVKLQFINNINNNFINSMSVNNAKASQFATDNYDVSCAVGNNSNQETNESTLVTKSSIFSKIIGYHYTTETYYSQTIKSSVEEESINTYKSNQISSGYA